MTENDVIAIIAVLLAEITTVRLVLKHRATQRTADRKAAKEATNA